MKTNVVSLLIQIQNAQNEIMRLNSLVSRHIFYQEIREIVDGGFSFERDGKRLAELVSQRDYPLTRSEIEEAFQTSGLNFTQEDIELAHPDGDSATKEYRDEQAADYASVFGCD